MLSIYGATGGGWTLGPAGAFSYIFPARPETDTLTTRRASVLHTTRATYGVEGVASRLRGLPSLVCNARWGGAARNSARGETRSKKGGS